MEKTKPTVDAAAEFFEIVMDFRDPRDAIREAISNAFDAGARTIGVLAEIISVRGQDELTLTFTDDGAGMQPEPSPGGDVPNLRAFFDLGNSTSRNNRNTPSLIGQKGHGTKTFFNSREVEVSSWRDGKELYALMPDPRASLAEGRIPEYDWETRTPTEGQKTGTKIVVRGYNQNRTRGFSHDELRDFIFWFTKFGSVEGELGLVVNKGKGLQLQGLGRGTQETLEFGHPFPREEYDLKSLRKKDVAAPTKFFVKKWWKQGIPVKHFPHYSLDIVFFIEGDKAKSYNRMIRRQRVEVREGMYSVEERYGLFACKDHIPIQNVTEWIARGQRAASTKYHAFVNCQQFKLTANRGDIGNTEETLLQAIKDTVNEWFDQEILSDAIYRKYEDELKREISLRKPEEEEKEHSKRKRIATAKKICVRSNESLLSRRNIEFFEPRQEIEVYAMFSMIYALNPDLFGFKVVDYDAHIGYDALVETKTTPGLDKESLRFVEFKRTLENEFNHSFSKLAAVVCWDCSLHSGDQLKDIRGEVRTLKITKLSAGPSYTKYMLQSDTDERNIEVFVLKDSLKERNKMEFRTRA